MSKEKQNSCRFKETFNNDYKTNVEELVIFNPEYYLDAFFRNDGNHVQEDTVSQTRRPQSAM
jgi:hypothetical protein